MTRGVAGASVRAGPASRAGPSPDVRWRRGPRSVPRRLSAHRYRRSSACFAGLSGGGPADLAAAAPAAARRLSRAQLQLWRGAGVLRHAAAVLDSLRRWSRAVFGAALPIARPRLRTGLFAGGGIAAVVALLRFLASPAIFSFDPFFGYYPGALSTTKTSASAAPFWPRGPCTSARCFDPLAVRGCGYRASRCRCVCRAERARRPAGGRRRGDGSRLGQRFLLCCFWGCRCSFSDGGALGLSRRCGDAAGPPDERAADAPLRFALSSRWGSGARHSAPRP